MKPRTDIAQKIRTDIVAGQLPFGSRLTIDQLALRYDTSHMPVREALRQLSGEGLIVTEPNRGARVRAINESFITELMDLRSGIEAQLAKRAAERSTELQIRQLEAIEDRFEDAIAQEDYESALVVNKEFHNFINSIGASSYPIELIKGHWLLLAALWHRYGYGPERFAGVENDHRHLIMALEAHDTHAAELITGAHVMKSKQQLLLQIRKTKQLEQERKNEQSDTHEQSA
ncbi:MAG: GntR family transcriptional regulator [Alphaproteobacteria bacterium]|nr:GntR family transcriptional regulator [Alphaproteobacteria bacterium]